jgi:molybdate transport system substrate-binding protein
MRLVVLLALLLTPAVGNAQTIFAAASLTDAMHDIATLWQQAGHPAPQMSFASSSTLARQIEQGAPAAIFASADEQWADYLEKRGLLVPNTRHDLLGNDLVLVVPADHPSHIDIKPGFDLAALLGPDGRLAVGDPAHVPVGIYAEQALKKLNLWDSVSPHLARTDDVRAGLLLVERGEAPAGIVYATDAAATQGVMIAGRFPPASHDPVTYPFALVKGGDTPEAKALFAFLFGPQARAAFEKRGFQVE